MQKEITVGNETIQYAVRRSVRARHMRLAVHRDGSVVLTAPARCTFLFAESFVYRQRQWLLEKLAFFRALPPRDPIARYGRREYLQYCEVARALVAAKLLEFAPHFDASSVMSIPGVSYGRVSIRNQKTCWGSCSRKGNLNFNYKILFLPEDLQNYVIVHELAHVHELSHSPRFWALVGSVMPNYVVRRRELRAMRLL
jgi:predicted metal-dependent hydrolase